MAITHAFSNTIADATGTVTVWNGATTSTVAASALVKPSDWNSAHAMAFTLTGNTTLNSTVSGTDIQFAGSGGIYVGGSSGTIVVSQAPIKSFVPWYPASTSTQTMGVIGVSSASAFVFPIVVDDVLVINHAKIAFSASVVTSNAQGAQTISSIFGIFTDNAGTLSSISTGSFSIAQTGSSVSGTISFPTSTGTGGYGYNTSSWSTTAQAQSLFGTAGNRVIDLQFGGNMTLSQGVYYIGLFQRQSTTGAALGISTALIGNAQGPATNLGYIGRSTADFTSNSAFHFNPGVATSTASANYGGSTLPGSIAFSGVNFSGGVLPLMTFMST